MREPVVLGIFVGGASTRMGGQPKGLLPAPTGEPLVSRTIAAGRAAGLAPVLVGAAEHYLRLESPAAPQVLENKLLDVAFAARE